jgi:signal transduction histidine kinase
LKKFILIFILGVVFYSCNKTKVPNKNSDYKQIDSLLTKSYDISIDRDIRLKCANRVNQILDHKINDSINNEYLLSLSGKYFNLGEFEKYVNLSREVYKKSLESKDDLLKAKSLSYIADYHYYKFSNDSAYFYYSKAEKTYSKLQDKKNIDRLKFYKANILLYEKDFLGCETAIIDILKTIHNKKDYRLIYDCNISLGNSQEGLNNNEKALEYYNRSSQIVLKLKDDPQYQIILSQLYNFIGKIYQKQNINTNALEFFNKSLSYQDLKNSDSRIYSNIINNLGYSNFKLGNSIAKSQLDEAFRIREEIKDIPGIVSSKINLAEYYLSKNDSIKAFDFCSKAKTLAHENRIFEDELKSLQLLAKIHPKNDGEYNNRYIILSDSLQNNERATRNKFARIEFETDEIISEKNVIEAERNKISVQRWIILGFGLLAIAIIGLLYVTKIQHSKNKELQFEKDQQKANEEIYQLMLDQQSKIDEGRQKEKKRISQELHDGVMSRLTSTRLNLFILSKRNDEETIKKCLKHIDDIQNIEKEIRNISHDLSQDIFTGKDSFEMIIVSLFESQKQITSTDFFVSIDPSINWELIDSATKMNIYRICQEALQNIRKYANAKNGEINITQIESILEIEIRDDGVGFNTEKSKSGIGLKNMNSRIASINGQINIESSQDKGTLIKIAIPT